MLLTKEVCNTVNDGPVKIIKFQETVTPPNNLTTIPNIEMNFKNETSVNNITTVEQETTPSKPNLDELKLRNLELSKILLEKQIEKVELEILLLREKIGKIDSENFE